MTIRPEQFAILKKHLSDAYVPYLPPLLQPKSEVEDLKKNVDRSFAAFAIDHICRLDPKKACKAVIDDFDDYGVDAIFYQRGSKTLYLVQAKLKAAAAFVQAEALAFSQGIRKLLNGDLNGFNANVQARDAEIRKALGECSKIEIVLAHTGDGLTQHAAKALNDLIDEFDGIEFRLKGPVVAFDAAMTVSALHSVNAVERVDCRLTLHNFGSETEPKTAFYGTVALSQLADLHAKHGKALYEKNIRTYLGRDTPVNVAIRDTLADRPPHFQYLNNGVTALCEQIAPKNGHKNLWKEFDLTGFSIINGAQTVASTAGFVTDNPDHDISQAKVMLTLIKADTDGDFGKAVTRARNHQNDVKEIAFAALDEEQERLRRQLAVLDIEYLYRLGESPSGFNPNRIMVGEAIQALALLEPDPRYAIWLKKSPGEFQRTSSEPYQNIFSQSLSAYRLVNAVRVYRYINAQVDAQVRSSLYEEKAAYKHGRFALAFVFAKQLRDAIDDHNIIDSAKLRTAAGASFDEARQELWNAVRRIDWPGPLAVFRNQAHGMPVIRKMMTRHYGLRDDPVSKQLAGKYVFGQPYQVDLFNYLAKKAPQIAKVT